MAKAIRTYATYLNKTYKDGVSNGLAYIDIIDENKPIIKIVENRDTIGLLLPDRKNITTKNKREKIATLR